MMQNSEIFNENKMQSNSIYVANLYQKALLHHNSNEIELALDYYSQILKIDPKNFDAWHMTGIVMAQTNDFRNSLFFLKEAYRINPEHSNLNNNLGNVYQKIGRSKEAIEYYNKAIFLDSKFSDAYINKAIALKEIKNYLSAEENLKQAIFLDSTNFLAYSILGLVYGEMNDWVNSYKFHDIATSGNPLNAEFFYNKANSQIKNKIYSSALDNLDIALHLDPSFIDVQVDRGIVFQALNRRHEALLIFESIFKAYPNFNRSKFCLGRYWLENNDFDKALFYFDSILSDSPDNTDALLLKATIYKEQGKYSSAIKYINLASAIDSSLMDVDLTKALLYQLEGKYKESLHFYNLAIFNNKLDPSLFNNRAAVFYEFKNYDHALQDLNNALNLDSKYVDALMNKAKVLSDLQRTDEALDCYNQAFDLNPDREFLEGLRLHTQMKVCEWSDYELRCDSLINNINIGKKVAPPFCVLAITDDLEIQKKASNLFLPKPENYSEEFPKINSYKSHKKIRLGYYSADFQNHATMYLMAQFFESHDKDLFELYAFSFGPNVRDYMRDRAINAFDFFFDVSNQTDEEIVHLSRFHEIDIAFDLKGCTHGNRTRIFSLRVAPIQINYLGYPGSMGVDYIDYIISDKNIIPNDLSYGYSEKVLNELECYQPRDTVHTVIDQYNHCSEVGLPDDKFIYCCFNNNYKITPEIFKTWMEILQSVPNSILWLLEDTKIASSNLKKHAISQGVDASRIIFAPRVEISKHLSRHKFAHLFLDTFPCNAHTTAADAIVSGLPLLTLRGKSFASRVASSLLTYFNQSDFIMNSLDEYKTFAIDYGKSNIKSKNILDSDKIYNTKSIIHQFENILISLLG